MPRSFTKGPRSGKVNLAQCRAMGIVQDMEDGSVRFCNARGNVWAPKEVLAIQDDPNRPPPQYRHDAGPSSSSQGGGFPNFQSITDLLQENLLCTRNTYNMASNAYTQIRAVEHSVSAL
ncbi:hypothetical protein Hanom_Chr11g01063901 [Helianthus anomalus]